VTSLGLQIHPTAFVSPNVQLGSGTIVGEYVILGRAPRGKKDGELPLVIGVDSVIRPFTTIYAGTTIGDRLQTGQGASIREDNVIGDDVLRLVFTAPCVAGPGTALLSALPPVGSNCSSAS